MMTNETTCYQHLVLQAPNDWDVLWCSIWINAQGTRMHEFKVCSCLMCHGKQYCYFFSDCDSGIHCWSGPHILWPSYCSPSIVPHSDSCPRTVSLHIPIETGLLFTWLWVSHLNCTKLHKKEMFPTCKIDIFFYIYYITLCNGIFIFLSLSVLSRILYLFVGEKQKQAKVKLPL
jgi:hypothetical protein